MNGLSEQEILRPAFRLTNYFENGEFEANYAAWENLGDDRGDTIGLGATQFDTDEKGNRIKGDMWNVFQRFQYLESSQGRTVPDSIYARWVSDKDFFQQQAKGSHNLRQSQFDINFNLYGKPALDYFKNNGLKLPIALAAIYDCVVQQGDGKDADSFFAIATRSKLFGKGIEAKRVKAFLISRRETLVNPVNKATKKVWSQSVDRVDALLFLLDKFPLLDGDYETEMSQRF